MASPTNGIPASLPPVPPPSPHPRRPNDARINTDGVSRFHEPAMQEYTPAHSLYEQEMDDEYEYDDDNIEYYEDRQRMLRKTLRAVNAALHMVACILLLAIMAMFLNHARRHHKFFHHSEPQAIALIILLVADLGLDAMTFVLLRRPKHPTGVIVSRLVLGLSYIALFMVYVGVGDVFPRHYTFWGLTRAFSGPVVYLFLWMLGVWNLLHTALHRHQVGRFHWRWWRKSGRRQQENQVAPALQPAVPMQTRSSRPRPAPVAPALGLPPPMGSTPTTAAPPSQTLASVQKVSEAERRDERGGSDKSMSSSVSSASTSTRITQVELVDGKT
ncbi:hypothetical protein SEUCBS140593_008549 [Sporothrix eucalyptigena]|uniref:Integral membrane protein n=1 Tax=Sporothrix eucalyptigena TaxID=1812306 RepID=A0ABP0CNX7_9PEZI